MDRKKLAACLAVGVMIVGCVACSAGKKKDSSKAAENSSAQSEDSSRNKAGDTEAALTAKDGQLITRAYDLLQSEQYSIRLVHTDPFGRETEIYRVVDGDDYYELQTTETGSSGCICVGGNAYDFDNVCGVYSKRTSGRPESLIETVVEQALPATDTNIAHDDAALYEVEEYTYTGGTYITVMDFYFDKETGMPVKYVTRYMVEEENGDEGMTEVRTIKEILFGSGNELVATDGESRELDKNVFDTAFLSELTDLDGMTAEQRLSFCRTLFMETGVSGEELAAEGMTDEMLKYISYEDLTLLVYTYGSDL